MAFEIECPALLTLQHDSATIPSKRGQVNNATDDILNPLFAGIRRIQLVNNDTESCNLRGSRRSASRDGTRAIVRYATNLHARETVPESAGSVSNSFAVGSEMRERFMPTRSGEHRLAGPPRRFFRHCHGCVCVGSTC